MPASDLAFTPEGTADDIILLIPVFNDWRSFTELLKMLDGELVDQVVRVLVVNDGSTDPRPPRLDPGVFDRISQVQVLELRCNLGHQRAIAIGLSFIEANLRCRCVVVMDGDGEDAPADVPRLLEALSQAGDDSVVFAERTRRSEGLLFRAGYRAYRMVHRPLTGIPVRIGNFSAIPRRHLSRLVVLSDLWNHYAATVVRSRIPMQLVPTARANRIDGHSKMNVLSLVIHGLSAIAVFRERVAARLLAATLFSLLAIAGVIGLFVVLRATGSDLGVNMTIVALAAAAAVQVVATLVVFTFVILGARDNAAFIPLRDHEVFVGDRWDM